MSVPRRAIGEDAILMLAQAGDDGPGERAGAHIGQGFVIDDVVAMPGAQQVEEVEAAFRAGGPEPVPSRRWLELGWRSLRVAQPT